MSVALAILLPLFFVATFFIGRRLHTRPLVARKVAQVEERMLDIRNAALGFTTAKARAYELVLELETMLELGELSPRDYLAICADVRMTKASNGWKREGPSDHCNKKE